MLYIDPKSYPNDEVSYALFDNSNQMLMLLQSSDQKLQLVEGMTVKVSGIKTMASGGKLPLLVVEKVEISGSN